MDCMTDLERMLFSNPVIQTDQYPPLDQQNLEIMRAESMASGESSVIYGYLREWRSRWFVDVYVNTVEDQSLWTERFIIADGYSMTADDEQRFFERLMSPYTTVNQRTCGFLFQEITGLLPELHLRSYDPWSHVFLHIYYCTHRSGIREQLFKIGLNEVAVRLGEIDEYNLLGTNVEEAFDVPLKMMRKLNTREAVSTMLRTKESRLEAKWMYQWYHNFINRFHELNRYQFDYLKECLEKETTPHMRFLKQLSRLRDMPDPYFEIVPLSDVLYQEFKKYRKNWSALGTYRTVFPQYPDLSDGRRFLTLAKLLEEYVMYEGDLDISVGNLAERWCAAYAFEDETYEIVIPTCLKDILQEADALHNCLHAYVYPIIRQETIILFIHEKRRKKRSCVCLEIRESDICQVKGICNQPLTAEQNQFVRAFAAAKGLEYSNWDGLDLFEDDDEEWDAF